MRFLCLLVTLTGSLLLSWGCRNVSDEHLPKSNGSASVEAGIFIPDDNPQLIGSGNSRELVGESLTFIDPNGVVWSAPVGSWTDGASVPRAALSVTNGRWDERFLNAALLHDAYCQEENQDRTPMQYRTRPWKEVHRMFYNASVARNTPMWMARSMYTAIWWFGPRWNATDKKTQPVSEDTQMRGYFGSKNWIVNEDPTLEEIEADFESRQSLLLKLHKLEYQIISAIIERKVREANTLLQTEGDLIASELERSPSDLTLLVYKGYWHKNRAMLGSRSRDSDRNYVQNELHNAELIFRAIIEHEPEDPGSWNGLGSVALLRGNIDEAEKHIRKALTISPGYQAALFDLQTVERLQENARPD